MEAFCQIPHESTGDCDCHIKRQRFLLLTSHIVVLTILQLSYGEDLGPLMKTDPSLSSKTVSIAKMAGSKWGHLCCSVDLFWGFSPLCDSSVSPLSADPSQTPSHSRHTDMASLRRRWRSGFKGQCSTLRRNHLQKARTPKTRKIKGPYFLGKLRRCSAMTDDMTVILTPYSPMLKLFMRTKHHMKNRLPDAK